MVSELSFAGVVPAATVAAAADGDADALARIVGAHHDDMARLAFVICGDADMAQDAVQSAWPLVWRKLDTLRDPTRLRPWLMSVAANQARQMLRSQRRRHVVEIGIADVAAPHHDPSFRADLADLGAALARLPVEDRTLLAMRFVAGFDAAEIGQTLGLSASGVRSRMSRLIARLRTELDR